MERLFGTDGVRGIANVEPMTAEIAMSLGRAIAYLCKSEHGRSKIVVGKDTRLSCYMLENAIVAGICSMGVDALLIGPMPTPGIAFITQSMRADAGVVISASHNLFQDNGIKFFWKDGYKLPDQVEAQIEELILTDKISNLRPTAHKVGKAFRIDDANGRYIVFVKGSFPQDMTLEGLRIVVDCANGATYRVAPTVLAELGAETFPLAVDPDGTNINLDCGSQHTERMRTTVKQHGADIGIAYDGDGDRAIFSDEKARIVNGDAVMAICGRDLIEQGRLFQNTVVATVMSNLGLELSLKEVGGKVVRAAVGDRYVVEEMRRSGCMLGGEQSGHIIFREFNTTGDGIISTLQVLALMKRKGKRLSELASVISDVPQVLVNVQVTRKPPISEIPAITSCIGKVEEYLGGEGRVLVRYSGTEPLLRVMIEGRERQTIQRLAEDIASVARKELS
jgi:phosphoglucosamine mutase